MNDKQIIALWLYNRHRKRQQKNRVFWVHPINARREEVGLFYNLFINGLRNGGHEFFNSRGIRSLLLPITRPLNFKF